MVQAPASSLLTPRLGAADRQPDSCTKNPDGARRLNVTATEHLSRSCSTHNCFLLYISTDYVFPGVRGQAPYKVSDDPHPTNIYGQTKLEGEKAVLRRGENAVVLRVPVLYGETEPKDNNKESAVNVLMDTLWKSQDRCHQPPADDTAPLKVDHYAIRYPTNTEDVARVCVDICRRYLSLASSSDASSVPTQRSQSQSQSQSQAAAPSVALPRILHFSSEDRMTKYEICRVFAEITTLGLDGIAADTTSGADPTTGPDGQRTLRPYDCHLDTAELRRLGIDLSTVDFVAWWRRYLGAYRR